MTPIKTISEINVELIQKMGDDSMIVAAAKVSTNGVEASKFVDAEANYGLINYLMKHRHGTPFEHACMTFFVHAPIFVWREWHRHRIGFCLAGDTVVDFVDINGTRSSGICRTIKSLYDRWEHGENNGRATDQELLAESLELVSSGTSIRTASEKTGIARGTIQRHRKGLVSGGSRGSRWRIEGMRARVLNEETNFFTSGHISDVYKSGIKELFLLNTESGNTLRCSKDHKILTQEGWTSAGELKKGDRIAVVGKRSMFAERQIPPSLRSGIGVWTSMQRSRLIQEEDACYICGNRLPRASLILDHVIPVVTDLAKALDITNLRPACDECHQIKSNGEQSLARRGCVAGSKFSKLIENPCRIAEEMTYDLSMQGPWHNFVANGIVVHNSYNEESGRYKQLDPVFWVPGRERKLVPSPTHKSARPDFVRLDDDVKYNQVVDELTSAYSQSYAAYENLLDMGVAKEVSRACLPVAIYSSCWVTTNPRSLMHFLSLRTHEEAFDPETKSGATFISFPQAEIEVAAREAENIFKTYWPLAYRSFCENGRTGP